MAGNYDTTSTIGKYQRALINANKPLRGTTGDKIFSALLSVIGGPVGTAVAVGSEIIKNLTPEKQNYHQMEYLFLKWMAQI